MRTIRKGREPRSLEAYRQSVDATFEGMPGDVKSQVREQLVEEQRGLCCYCQSRIRATPVAIKIEHWQCQASHPERQLDYGNLLGACLGGHGRPEREQHCDTRKGNKGLCFSVCDPAHPIERQIHFLGDGKISADDAPIDEALNAVLNLNLPRLVSNRRAVLAAFQQRPSTASGRSSPMRRWPSSAPPKARCGRSWKPARRADRRTGAGIAVQMAGHHGTLATLRHGFKCFGKTLRVAFFRPAHGLNPELEARYQANRLGSPGSCTSAQAQKSRWMWCCRSTAFRW
jgi:uncharacterized protein (TIGR02646 family)